MPPPGHEAPPGLAEVLATAYGLPGAAVCRLPAGTATANYLGTAGGRPVFVKHYSPGTDLDAEQAAVELSEYVATWLVPTARIIPTRAGALLHRQGPYACSVWERVDASPPGRAGMTREQMASTGRIVGRLHRVLAAHPAAPSALVSSATLCDPADAHRRFTRLLAALPSPPLRDAWQEWAADALTRRLALLPRIAALLDGLAPLRRQVVHGDLAAPNVLLRGTEVAALIDFRPPRARPLAWEISRIACDPGTVLHSGNGPLGSPASPPATSARTPADTRRSPPLSVPGPATPRARPTPSRTSSAAAPPCPRLCASTHRTATGHYRSSSARWRTSSTASALRRPHSSEIEVPAEPHDLPPPRPADRPASPPHPGAGAYGAGRGARRTRARPARATCRRTRPGADPATAPGPRSGALSPRPSPAGFPGDEPEHDGAVVGHALPQPGRASEYPRAGSRRDGQRLTPLPRRARTGRNACARQRRGFTCGNVRWRRVDQPYRQGADLPDQRIDELAAGVSPRAVPSLTVVGGQLTAWFAPATRGSPAPAPPERHA
ncbi:phosphotransferase [Bailinhaonella thermotolerans]|uniref:Aminoglycoside phosphotransferase domain-containing protein n=1 Tax=Bailinhaonella thermotolerans TaxID=1070861 RepID=A0A3A4A5U5_9ACTN|nr:hypothetical protein D5H75_33210 [Bailinhaonella thermotolerans]